MSKQLDEQVEKIKAMIAFKEKLKLKIRSKKQLNIIDLSIKGLKEELFLTQMRKKIESKGD